jgi:hypothetical protein
MAQNPIVACLVCLAAISVQVPSDLAEAAVLSTFDTDDEGWTTFQNADTEIGYSAIGGNSGGHITTIDQDSGWTYVQAPDPFLVPAMYDGSLSFDLRVFTSDPVNWPIEFGVRTSLVGNGLTLINELAVPDGTWTNYSFTLNETAGWRIFPDLNQNYSVGALQPTQSQMQGVLENLSGLFIATDYNNRNTLQGVID